MKKSNIIILTAAAAASVLLLGLWFFLGFNHVDAPLDPAVTLAWWVVIAVAALAISKVESKRRERIRSVYVGDGQLFNSESGLVAATPGAPMVDNVEAILEGLDYGFGMQDLPEKSRFVPRVLVRTVEYRREGRGDSSHGQGDVTWEGEVLFCGTDRPHRFRSPEELRSLLSLV